MAKTVKTKICYRCKTAKSLEEFGIRSREKDGRNGWCRLCYHAYYTNYRKTNRKKLNRYHRNWCAENPESVQTIRDKFYEAHPERMGEYSVAWRLRFPDRRRRSTRRYRAANLGKDKESRKAWAKKNKALLAAKAAKRRADKIKATPPWVDVKAIEKIYKKARRLSEKTGLNYEVDHIYPLKHPTCCGLHVPWNLRIVLWRTNRKKRNLLPKKSI